MPYSRDIHTVDFRDVGRADVWHTTTSESGVGKQISLQLATTEGVVMLVVWLTLQEARDLATILEFSAAQYEE